MHQNHLEGFLKHRLMSPTPRVSDSTGSGSGLSYALVIVPPDVDAAGSGAILEEPLI